MVTYCYFDGKIMSAKQAMVSIYDIGLLRGYGIYEALTTHNGKPFMLKEHLERFRRSANFLDLKIPMGDQELTQVIQELIVQNGYKESNIKFILTGGNIVAGIEFDSDFPTFYILVEEFSSLPEHFMTKGTSVITHEHQRQYPQFKTTNYITAVMLQKQRKEKGALEILYTSNGKVLECATSNFFIIKNNVLITPKENVLLGITRKVVIDLAQKNNIKVEERDITIEELHQADEAFLTASFKEVVPVVKVDEKMIGNGHVGPLSKKMFALFSEFTKHY